MRLRSGYWSFVVELYKCLLKELEMKVLNVLNVLMMKENIDKENINVEDKCV